MQSRCRHIVQKLFCSAKDSSVFTRGYLPAVTTSAFSTSNASSQSDTGLPSAASFPWSTFASSLRGETSKHAFGGASAVSWPSYETVPMRSPSAVVSPLKADPGIVVPLDVEAAWTKLCGGAMLQQADNGNSVSDSFDMTILNQSNSISNGCRHPVFPIEIPPHGNDAVPLECIKRTYQPGVLIRKRRHGFLSRLRTANGRRVLARRKAKGRRKISA